MRSPSKLLNVWLLSCASLLAAAGAANAQCIPTEVVQRISVSADDERVIAGCVTDHSKNLGSEKPELIRADRASLLEPLADRQVSASFRVKYAKALLPIITPLAENTNEIVAINALIIAGELGTDGSADVVKKYFDRQQTSVRYQATYAAGRTFETMTAPSPAISVEKAAELLRTIETRMGVETDPLVIDGLVRASLAAAQVNSLRNQALETLGKGVEKIAAASAKKGDALADPVLESCLRAAAGVRAVIALPSVTVSREAALASAGLGGDLMSAVSVSVARKKVPLGKDTVAPAAGVSRRELHAQAAIAAETLVLVVGRKLNGDGFGGQAKEAGKSLRDGTVESDATFLIDAQELIGAKGLLSQKPFEFAKDRFPAK